MVYIIIALMVLAGFIRTISFGVWNFKNKNTSGAIALFFLAIIFMISSLINLLS